MFLDLYCFVPSNVRTVGLILPLLVELWPVNQMYQNSLASGWRARSVGTYSGAGMGHRRWHQQSCLFFSSWQSLSRLDSCSKEHRCFLLRLPAQTVLHLRAAVWEKGGLVPKSSSLLCSPDYCIATLLFKPISPLKSMITWYHVN